MSSLGVTVLNVDDDEVARYAKHRSLRHAGFDVIDAASGAEGLAALEVHRLPVVLLDVRLPDVNGIDLCKTIKQRWPGTAVLQTSATFITAEDRARGLEGGADSYLVEPVDPAELVAAVRALLRMQQAEEGVRQLNRSLEERVAERTRELHQTNVHLIEQIAQRERAEAALVQSQKMEAVGQLTGSMAHDFNNILASMVGYIHLVRRMTPDAQLHDMLDRALNAAERGKRLTTRLLAFSRADGLVTAAVDVGALVVDMQDWLKQTVGSGVELALQIEPGAHIAVTDANQLELALLNVVINARDAMPEGGRVTIEVAPRTATGRDAELPPGPYVVVTVTDSGVGMAPEVAAQALMPFFTTKPAGRGTGLGLAQVANLCRLSKGATQVSSRPGEGTVVALWLAASTDPLAAAEATRTAPPGVGHGERIVLVDDEADIRRTVSGLLADQGYVVEAVGSGMEALKLIERSPPALLLLDFAMPGMSGVEVAQRVRALHPELPIIFLSGHASRTVLETAVPGVDVLAKPFRTHDLFARISGCLGNGSGAA